MGEGAINRVMGPLEWGLLAGLSVLWGGSFFFVGVAVGELPPFTIVLLRVALAAAVLHLAIRALGVALPRGGQVWAAFFGMGLLNNLVPFCLLVWGQTQIASGLASILNATTPLFGVLVAHLLTEDERMTGGKLAGVALGIAGVVTMIGPDALDGLGGGVWAQLACLGAALSYACAGIFGRRFRRMGVAPMATATGQVTASTILLAPLALWIDRPWTLAMPGWEVWAAMAGLAVFSTALAYIVYFRLLASAGATNVVLVTFLVPVSAILLGVAFLGERLEPSHLAGMGAIGLGLMAIDGRAFAALRRRGAASAGP